MVPWFSALVPPAKYPSSVLEVSVPVGVAQLQHKPQHFKTVLNAVLLVPLAAHACVSFTHFVLVQVVKLLKHRVS